MEDNTNPNFGEVLYLIEAHNRGETELPVLSVPILLENGSTLADVTPFAIIETTLNGRVTLGLCYQDRGLNISVIDINDIAGLRVVPGEGEYAGRLLLAFYYYKPIVDEHTGQLLTQQIEAKPRIILPLGISYGLTLPHAKLRENPDFYIVGQDTQYTTELPIKRVRVFPSWRTGMLGDPRAVEAEFRPG